MLICWQQPEQCTAQPKQCTARNTVLRFQQAWTLPIPRYGAYCSAPHMCMCTPPPPDPLTRFHPFHPPNPTHNASGMRHAPRPPAPWTHPPTTDCPCPRCLRSRPSSCVAARSRSSSSRSSWARRWPKPRSCRWRGEGRRLGETAGSDRGIVWGQLYMEVQVEGEGAVLAGAGALGTDCRVRVGGPTATGRGKLCKEGGVGRRRGGGGKCDGQGRGGGRNHREVGGGGGRP